MGSAARVVRGHRNALGPGRPGCAPAREPGAVATGPAGYSGTPLPKKLGIRPGMRVGLVDAPGDFGATLGELPPAVELRRGRGGGSELIVAFFTERRRYSKVFPDLVAGLPPDGTLWVAWPKKAAGMDTDMDEHAVRAVALPAGWVDVKVCAVDAIWSGLKLVLRKELRPSRALRTSQN